MSHCTLLALCLTLMPAARDGVVLIDPGWLARRGGGPYLLDRAATTYRLTTDVRTAGTAFVVDAADVTLDLNGHTVVYGDAPPLPVRNGGFEDGSGRSVPGWDLDAAPAAALAANTTFLFGKQVLRLTAFTTPQRIVSAPIVVPATKHLHVAAVTPARGAFHTVLQLSVLDADSGQVLGTGQSTNVERGTSAVARFQPGAARRIVLRLDVTPAPGKPASLDLDAAVVLPSGDHGILATNAWTGEIPGWSNLARAVPALGRKVSRLTIRNGIVRQGAGRGHDSSPLFCVGARGLVIEDVSMLTTGLDTNTVQADRTSGPVTVRRCTFRHDVENITDRLRSIAALRLGQAEGPIVVEECRFLAVPQVGILLDGVRSGRPVRIRRNQLEQRAVVTNGYAIAVAGSRHFEIADNRIMAENGRGIDIDSYRREPVEDGVIRHNHVEVHERLNREYWTRMEARALRLRNTVDAHGAHRRLRIHDNTLIAHADAGPGSRAYAVRLTYQNRDGSMSHADVRLEHNTLKAIAHGVDPTSRVSALAIAGLDAGVDLHIRDNVLEGNDSALTLGDGEGDVTGITLVGNTLVRSTEGAARPYVAIHAGNWTQAVRRVALLDTRLRGGAELGVRWSGSAVKEVGTGRLLRVRTAAGASVVVKDAAGAVQFRGTADDRGELRDIPLVTRRYRQTTPDGRQDTIEASGPFEVTATRGDRSARRSVEPHEGETIVLKVNE